MDRFEAMKVLVAAAEAGSLSAAGRNLGMPLATVSRKVADLEAHLGTRLLVRSNRRLGLTEAGQSYVAASRRILDEVAAAERAAAGEYQSPRGELIVTAPVAFGRLHVVPLVSAFLQAYPDIDMRLALSDRWINLIDDHVDLAVRIGALPDSSLVAVRLGELRRVFVASPGYLARRGEPRVPADLATHDCIDFEIRAAVSAWSFHERGAEILVPIRTRLAVTTAEAAVDAAAAGVGLTRVLIYQAAAALRAGSLRTVLDGFAAPPSPVHLVHAGGLLAQKLRAFIDFATPRLRAIVAELDRLRTHEP